MEVFWAALISKVVQSFAFSPSLFFFLGGGEGPGTWIIFLKIQWPSRHRSNKYDDKAQKIENERMEKEKEFESLMALLGH